jgi:hypothetical protein
VHYKPSSKILYFYVTYLFTLHSESRVTNEYSILRFVETHNPLAASFMECRSYYLNSGVMIVIRESMAIGYAVTLHLSGAT